MREVVLVPTYLRPEMLYCCLRRIRAIEPNIPIAIFPDRGSQDDPKTMAVVGRFVNDGNMQYNFIPVHDYHGNTYNVMEAFRWAFNEGYDRIFYIEDDVMVHADFFKWHREMQEDEDFELFASCGWVFNRHAPLTNDPLFQPWYYSVGTCFARRKLHLIVEHATPIYYRDMQKYVKENFKDSPLNNPAFVAHYEQDGLIQRILDKDRTTTVTPGIAKCTHIGFYGYNQGWKTYLEDIFGDSASLNEKIDRLEDFIADPHWRASVFDREVVEREIGHKLPKIENRYRITMPGNFETEFRSELPIKKLPKRINSVDLGPYATIENVEII
jgi:hypothetical protein